MFKEFMQFSDFKSIWQFDYHLFFTNCTFHLRWRRCQLLRTRRIAHCTGLPSGTSLLRQLPHDKLMTALCYPRSHRHTYNCTAMLKLKTWSNTFGTYRIKYPTCKMILVFQFELWWRNKLALNITLDIFRT